MANRTSNECNNLDAIAARLKQLTTFLNSMDLPTSSASSDDWHEYLTAMKAIEGNMDNDASFVACLMAKEYLMSKFPMSPFDVSEKHQNASGYDISATTKNGKRIVAEIKTTTPAGRNGDLGANQKATFRKDFAKLNAASADLKFFFVTDLRAFEVVKSKYVQEIPEVTVVLLPDDKGR